MLLNSRIGVKHRLAENHPPMQSYKQEFIEFALECNVLRFGDFTLKSGRKSPYFFNSGLFNSGVTLARLGRYYAEAIRDAGVEFDMLYGAAYKGIPLVAATAIGFADHTGRDLPWCFNRKEVKDHGERGALVGASPRGRVLMIDDVVSAGTSVRESIAIIRDAGATPAGIVVALDRQERGQGPMSAMQEVKAEFEIETASIVNLANLMQFLESDEGRTRELESMQHYLINYGCGC